MKPPPGFLKVSMSDVFALKIQFVILRFFQSEIANATFTFVGLLEFSTFVGLLDLLLAGSDGRLDVL